MEDETEEEDEEIDINDYIEDCSGERIFIIAPEEFGDIDGYETTSLNYFTDGVLADIDGEVLNNVEELIGDREVLTHFGEYEDDTVFVRNEKLEIDIEICVDSRKYSDLFDGRYSDVFDKKPHQMED